MSRDLYPLFPAPDPLEARDVLGARQLARGGIVVGSRGFFRGTRGTVDHDYSCGLKHYFPQGARSIRLLYGNWYYGSGNYREQINTNAIALRAAIEDSEGNIFPVFFNGSRDVTIQGGGFALTDPLHLDISAGDWIRSRTYINVSTGEYVPLAAKPFTSLGEGCVHSAGAADYTLTAWASWSGLTQDPGPGPLAVLGETDDNRVPSLLILGDSIANGANDYDAVSGSVNVYGWVRRTLGNDVAFIQTAYTGDRLEYFTPRMGHRMRGYLAGFCSHALIALGANDVAAAATLAQMQSRIRDARDLLEARGCRLILVTIPPKATSTDGFRTLTNQTQDATNDVRVAFNEWLRFEWVRSGGILWDLADLTESARNSGKWYVGQELDSGTAQGTHTTTSMQNTTKSWGTTALVGKTLVLKTGTYANTPVMITSHTNTQLNFSPALGGAPSNGNEYTVGEYPSNDGIHPNPWVHERVASLLRARSVHLQLSVP